MSTKNKKRTEKQNEKKKVNEGKRVKKRQKGNQKGEEEEEDLLQKRIQRVKIANDIEDPLSFLKESPLSSFKNTTFLFLQGHLASKCLLNSEGEVRKREEEEREEEEEGEEERGEEEEEGEREEGERKRERGSEFGEVESKRKRKRGEKGEEYEEKKKEKEKEKEEEEEEEEREREEESKNVLEWMFRLTKQNMEQLYNQDWDDTHKLRELRNIRSKHIIALQNQKPVGFCHFRFDMEQGTDILYLYEIQLITKAQGKGLGKHFMQIMEQTSRFHKMTKVMLTVQNGNKKARTFYQKMGYVLDGTSPSGREAASAGFRVLSKVV